MDDSGGPSLAYSGDRINGHQGVTSDIENKLIKTIARRGRLIQIDFSRRIPEEFFNQLPAFLVFQAAQGK